MFSGNRTYSARIAYRNERKNDNDSVSKQGQKHLLDTLRRWAQNTRLNSEFRAVHIGTMLSSIQVVTKSHKAAYSRRFSTKNPVERATADEEVALRTFSAVFGYHLAMAVTRVAWTGHLGRQKSRRSQTPQFGFLQRHSQCRIHHFGFRFLCDLVGQMFRDV